MADKQRRWAVRYLASAALLLSAVISCVAYVQRLTLLIHYRSHQFAAGRDTSPATLAFLEANRMSAIPLLAGQLSNAMPGKTERIGAAIVAILGRHADPTNPDDSHVALALAARLHGEYRQLLPGGRRAAVAIAFAVLEPHLAGWSPNVPTALDAAGGILLHALRDHDVETKQAALVRLPLLWKLRSADGVAAKLVEDWKLAAFKQAAALLESQSPQVRAGAATALGSAPFVEREDALMPLIDDADPAVCKAAVLALAESTEPRLTADQRSHLCELLHGGDEEVDAAIVQILEAAKLSPARIALATLRNHPDAGRRAKLAELAVNFPASDPVPFDPAPFLLELCDDPSAVVRRAVVAVAGRVESKPLRERVRRLAETDPDRAVRTAAHAALEPPRLSSSKVLPPK